MEALLVYDLNGLLLDSVRRFEVYGIANSASPGCSDAE